MIFNLLPKIENFERLKTEVFDLINSVGDNVTQIMCQTLNDNTDDFLTGAGRIDELDHQDEDLYKYVQPKLKGSYIEELILKHNAFRTRILKLGPRACYSIHPDPTPRIHIPIVTNEQCWMIWPYHSTCLNFKEGNCYWVDTRKPHTYINGDKELVRIHLVMVVK
jgi:hypothetical protein